MSGRQFAACSCHFLPSSPQARSLSVPPIDDERRTASAAQSRVDDETLIVPPPEFRGRDGGRDDSAEQPRQAARGQVALVEGSAPHLSQEIHDLLRGRLRIAAVVFFSGFVAFLTQWYFNWEAWSAPVHRSSFYAHIAVTLVLGLLVFKLCRRCPVTLAKLRLAGPGGVGRPG